jgi:hypothetical protein
MNSKHAFKIILLNLKTPRNYRLQNIPKQQQQQTQQLFINKRNLFNFKKNNFEKPPAYQFLYITSLVLGTSLGLLSGFLANFNLQFYLRGQDANIELSDEPYKIDTGLRRQVF